MDIHLSQFNELGQDHLSFPENVMICDVTIRDGEQTPGVSFTLEEKIEFVKMLDKMGVPQIQMHASGRNMNSRNETKVICNLGLASKIEVMTYGTNDDWKQQVEAAIDCGADIIHSLMPMSEITRSMGASLSDEQILKRSEEIVNYVRTISDKPVNISLIDATRSNHEFLLKTVDRLAEIGVERIRIADTAGVTTPDGISYLINSVKETTSKYKKEPIIGLHCHNDFGFGLANVFAGVKAGVTLVDVSVNGLGERAGNPSLAEVVTGLELLYKVKTNIALDQLFTLSEYVAQVSCFPIPTNMPLVGEYAFADESDVHIKVKKDHPLAFQGIHAKAVGNESKYIIGENSGPYTLKVKCEELGLKLPPEKSYETILNEIKEQSELNKGKVISDSAFVSIITGIPD